MPMILRPVALILLACLAVAGCERVDPNSPLGQRKALFKQMLKESEDLGGMLRGRIAFDQARFAEGAQRLDQLSRQPWQHFPPPEADEQGNARPELWQRHEHFQQLARDMEAATAALREASARTPLQAPELAAPMQRVEDACEVCHKAFRAF